MGRYFNDNELYHFGIKHRSGRYKYGSGERPYQGEGGIPKAHKIGLGLAIGGGAAAGVAGAIRGGSKYLEPNIKGGKDKPNVSAFETTTKQAGKAVESIQGTHRQLYLSATSKPTSKQAKEMAKMSNQELQAVITRKNLERNYIQATQDPAIEEGYNRTQNILAIAGTAATVAGAGATIYSAFRLSKKS